MELLSEPAQGVAHVRGAERLAVSRLRAGRAPRRLGGTAPRGGRLPPRRRLVSDFAHVALSLAPGLSRGSTEVRVRQLLQTPPAVRAARVLGGGAFDRALHVSG